MQHFNRSTVARLLVAVLATTAMMACGDDDSPNLVTAPTVAVTPGTAVTAIVSGNAQTVARGQTSAPLVIRAFNANGGPIANATVTWTIVNGGTLSATSTTTDANGDSQVTVTAGSVARAYTVTASVAGTTSATIFVYVP
jgi:hypothetical protein